MNATGNNFPDAIVGSSLSTKIAFERTRAEVEAKRVELMRQAAV